MSGKIEKTRILVVEDESIIALDIMTNLVNLGFEAPAAAMTAEEAVEKAAELLPDLVLMDIQLKGKTDGIEAARIIRERHKIPIVYMTGNADLSTVNRARATEPYGYIIKPVNLQDLFSTIDTALQRHRYDEEIRLKNIELASVNEEFRRTLEELEATNEELSAAMEEQQATNEQLIISNEELAVAQKDILESNRMLAKGEQRFRGLFESMTEGVALYELIFDKGIPVDYYILDVNTAFETHTGLSQEKVKGFTGSQFYGFSPPPYLELCSQVAITGLPECIETFFSPLNRHFKIAFFSPGKNLFATVFEDITEQKKMEEILKATQYAIDNAKDSVMRILSDGTIIYANDAAADMTGIQKERLVSSKIGDFYPRLDSVLWESFWQKLKREVSIKYEAEHETNDGKILLLEITDKYLVFDSVEFVLRVARDITLLRDSLRKEEESRDELENFFSLSLDMFCIADVDGHFLRLNPAWERNLGYTNEELMRVKFTDFIHPDDLQSTYNAMSDLSDNREVMNFVNRYRRKDGSYCWLEWRSFPRGKLIYAVAHDVTKKRLAEEQLRMSEEKFRKVFYVSPDSININRLSDGVYIEINQGFTSMTGYTPEDVIGRSSLPGDLGIWVNAEDRMKIVKGLTDDGEVRGLEARFRRKDGTELVGLMSAKVIEINGEKYNLSITRDISERKKVEDVQKKVANEWQATFDSVADMIWLLDPEGMILRSNGASINFLGLTPSEVVGKFCCKVMHDTARPVPDCPVNRMKETLKRETMELQYHEKWLNVSVDPISGDDGSLQGIVHIVSDITHRKKMEETLRENDEKLRFITDNSADAIWHTDERFVFTYVSPAGEKILDLLPGEMIGKSIIDMVEPEERELMIRSNEKRIEQERKGETTADMRYEIRMRKKDGIPVWFEVNVNPYRDHKGAITGYYGISRNISERKKADQILKSSLLEKEVLIKEIHHRVKNNLQMINSLLNLQSAGVDDRIVKEKFLTLQNRIRSMAIVHERLYKSEDLGRIDFEDYINIIVYELSGNYSITRKINGVKITTQKIYLDIDRAIPCGLILNELMTNSYKYAFPDDWEGTPEVSVDLSLGEHNMVVLTVSDNGVGIPFDEKMSNVSTLGLSLVKMLTAQLQGTFQIDTKKGTRFQINFPVI